MKSILTTLLLFPICLCAQISIGSNSMPSSGDTLRYTIAILDTAVLLNYQNAGPNQSWNFNQLVPQRQGVSEFKASSQTPYPNIRNRTGEKVADTLSLQGIELYDFYNFYTNSSSEFAMDYRGAGFPTGISFYPVYPIENAFADKDEVYQFPLDYGDNDSSTYQFVFQSPNIPGAPSAYYQSSGTRVNNVDAWGTITTAFGTFQTIRVVTDLISYDSISFDGTNFGIPNHRREYKWLSNQEKIPVLIVQGAVLADVFVPALVQYRDSIRDVPGLLAPTALFTADTTVYEINQTVQFNNQSISIIGAQYNWSILPNNYQFMNGTNANSENPTVQFSDTGLYNVQLIAQNTDGKDTLLREKYLTIVEPNGIKDYALSKFTISPNPIKANEKIRIESELNLQIINIQIIDIKGRIVSNFDWSSSQKDFIFPKTKKGLYLIQISTSEGEITKKVVVD